MLRITSSLRLPVASSSSSSSISSTLSHSSSTSSFSQQYYVASRAGHTYRFLLNEQQQQQQQQQQKGSPSNTNSNESLFLAAHQNDRERLQKQLANKNENSPSFTAASPSSSSTSSAIQLSRELSTILSDCSKLVDYTISVIKNTPLNSTDDELLSSCSSLSGISLNHWHRGFDLLSQALRNNNNSTNNNPVTNYDERSTPQSTQKVSTLHFNLALAIASKCLQWYPMQQCEGVMASSAFNNNNNNNNNNTHSESSNKHNNTNDDKFKSSASSSLYWADVHTLNIFMAASLSTGDWMNALELFQSGLEEEEERLRRSLITADDSSSSSSASSQKQQQQEHLHHINHQSIKLALRAAVEGSQGASPNYSLLLSSSSSSSSSATRNHQAQRIRRIIQQYHHLQQQQQQQQQNSMLSNTNITTSSKYYFTPRWQEALNLHKLFPHHVESDPMMISLVVRAAASNARLDGKVLQWWRKTSQQQQEQQQRYSSSTFSSSLSSLDNQARLDLSRVAERSLSWETALELAIRTCIISEQQQEQQQQQQREARAATRKHFKTNIIIIKKLVSSAIVTAHRAGQDQAVVSLFHYCKVLDLMMINNNNKSNNSDTDTNTKRTTNNNTEEVKITAVLQNDPQSLSCIALSCSRLGKLNELVAVKQRANELLGYVPSEIYHAMLSLLDRHYYHSCLHHNYNNKKSDDFTNNSSWNDNNKNGDDFGTSDIVEDDENSSSKSSSSSVTMILSKQRELIRDWLMSASSSSLTVSCRKLFSLPSNDNDFRTEDVCTRKNDNAFDSTSSSSSSSLLSSTTTSTVSLFSQAFDELLSQTQNPDCMTFAAASEILVQLFHLGENKKYEAGNNDDKLSTRVVKLLELASSESLSSSSSSSSSSSYFQRPMFASCISSLLEILIKTVTPMKTQQQQHELFTKALQCCLQMKFDDGPIFKKALNTAMKKMTMMNSKFMTDANNNNISQKEIFHPPIKSASSSSLSLINELKSDDTSKLLFLMDKVNRLRFDDDHDQQEKSLLVLNEIIQQVTVVGEGDVDTCSLIVSKTIILSLLRKLFSHSSVSSSSASTTTAYTLLNEVLSSLEMLLETQQQQQQQHSVLHFTLTDDDCRGFLDQYTIKERLRLLLAMSASSDFSHILETEKLAKLLVRFTDLFYNFAIASPFSQQNRLPAALAECVLNLLEHLAMMVHDAAAHYVVPTTTKTSTSSVSDVETEIQEEKNNTTKSSSSFNKMTHLLSQIELFCWKEADIIYNRMMSVESMSRFRNRLAFAKISAVLASSSSSSLSSCSTSQTVFGDDTKTNNNNKIKNSSIVTTTTHHDGTKKRTTLTRSYVASIAIKLLCKTNNNNNNNNNTDYIAKHLSKIRNPTLIATIINRLGTTMKKDDKVKLLQSQWSSSSSLSALTASQSNTISRRIDNSTEENDLTSTHNNNNASTSTRSEIMTLFASHLRTDPDSLSTKAISMAIQGITAISSSSKQITSNNNNNNNNNSIPQPLIEILSSVQAADDGMIMMMTTKTMMKTNGQLTGRCALAIISSYHSCSDDRSTTQNKKMMMEMNLKTIKMLKTVFDRLLTQAAVEGIDTTKSDYWKGAAACLVVRVSHEILLLASVISSSSAENLDSSIDNELSKIFEESISTFRRICSLNTRDDSNSNEEGSMLLLISRLKNCIRNIADDLLPSCYLWSSLMMSSIHTSESGIQPNKNNSNHNHQETIFAKKCTLCVALASIRLSSFPLLLETRNLEQQQQQPRSLLEAFGLGANLDILMMSPPTSMVTTTSHHSSRSNNNNSNNSIALIQEAAIEWMRKEIATEEHHNRRDIISSDDVLISSRRSLLRFHTTADPQQKQKQNANEKFLALQPAPSFSVVDDCLHLLSACRKRPAKLSPSFLEQLLRKLIMRPQNKIETTNITTLHQLESTLSSFVFPLLLEINPSSISPISAVVFLAAVEVVKEASIDENDDSNSDNDDTSFDRMTTMLISEKIAHVSNDSSLVCDFLLSPEAIEISKIVALPLVRYTARSTASSLFHQHQQDEDGDQKRTSSLPLLSYSLCSCLFRICVSNNAWTLAEQIRVMRRGSSNASDFSLAKNDNLLLVESLVEYLTKSCSSKKNSHNNKMNLSSSPSSPLSSILIDAFTWDARDIEKNTKIPNCSSFVSDLVRMSCRFSSSNGSFDDVKFLSGLKLLEESLSIHNIQQQQQSSSSSSSLTHFLLIELIKMKNCPKANFVVLTTMNNKSDSSSSVVLVTNIFDQFLRNHSASIVLQFLSLSSSSSASRDDLIRTEITRVSNSSQNTSSFLFPNDTASSHLPKSSAKKQMNNHKEGHDLVDENLIKKQIATMTRPILKLSGGDRDNNKKKNISSSLSSASSSSFRDLLLGVVPTEGRSSKDSPTSSSKKSKNAHKLHQSIIQWFVLTSSTSPDKHLMTIMKKTVTVSSLLNVCCHLLTTPHNSSSSDVHYPPSTDDHLIYELGFSAIDDWVLLHSPKKDLHATIKSEEQNRHYDEIFDFLELWTGIIVSSSTSLSVLSDAKSTNKVPLLVTLERVFKTLLAHSFVEMTRYLKGRHTTTTHRQLNLKNTAKLISNLCSCITNRDKNSISSLADDDNTGVEEVARDVKESFLKLISFIGDVESLLVVVDDKIDNNGQRRLVKTRQKIVDHHHHHHARVLVGCCFLVVRNSEEKKKVNEHAADENGMMTTLAIRKYRQLLAASTSTTTNGTRHQQPRSKKPSKEFYAYVAKVMKAVLNATSQQNQQNSIEDLMGTVFNQVMGRRFSTPTAIAAPRPRVVSPLPPPRPPPAPNTTLPTTSPVNNKKDINEVEKQDQSHQQQSDYVSSSSSSSWQQAIEYAQEYINTTREIVSNLNKNSDDKNISSTTKTSQQKLTELTQKLMSSDDHHGGLKSIIDSHQAIKTASSVSSWVISSRIFAELLSLSNNENTTTTKKNNSSSSSSLSILAQLHRRRLDLIYSFARRHLWHVQRWSTDSLVVRNQASALALAALDYEQKRSEKLNKKRKIANKKINNQRRQEITSATNKKSLIIRSQPFLFLLMDLTKPAAQSSSLNTSIKTPPPTTTTIDSSSLPTEDSSIPLPLRIFDELVSDEFVSSSSTSSKTVDGTLQSFEPLNCALESLIVMKRQQQHKHQKQRCLYYAELIVERFVRAAPELLKRSKEDAKEAAAARKFVSLMVGESGVSAKSLEKVLAVIGSYRE